ncbi:hypothetical protein BN1200_450077 [Klebsiella variicola]|nr:hypothetical protein BN1200_450077 [Klebsiella variicola]
MMLITILMQLKLGSFIHCALDLILPARIC